VKPTDTKKSVKGLYSLLERVNTVRSILSYMVYGLNPEARYIVMLKKILLTQINMVNGEIFRVWLWMRK
jgi:hypothetical protein